ncbi:hypothetical protein TNCV_5125011 [Trichonephila clavipes]|nr:hypothetical protein TNCV_5125011 [Trichonephila clavipes]
MALHRPRKSAPTKYTMDEEDMIIYDVCVEDEPESNPKYVLNRGGYTYKGELVNKPIGKSLVRLRQSNQKIVLETAGGDYLPHIISYNYART